MKNICKMKEITERIIKTPKKKLSQEMHPNYKIKDGKIIVDTKVSSRRRLTTIKTNKIITLAETVKIKLEKLEERRG